MKSWQFTENKDKDSVESYDCPHPFRMEDLKKAKKKKMKILFKMSGRVERMQDFMFISLFYLIFLCIFSSFFFFSVKETNEDCAEKRMK